jgi:hypothetical protein
MAQTGITDDQREMAVAMLANAIRKDAHLRNRARHARDAGNPLIAVMASRRSEPSQRYVDGMRDILKVLFANGGVVAEECLEEAYARALGVTTPASDNGRTYQ